MIKRISTAVVLIAAIVACIWLKGWLLRGAMLVIMLACTVEIYRAFSAKGMRPIRWPGYLFCALAVGWQACGQVVGVEFPPFYALDPALLALSVGALCGICAVVLAGKVDFERLVATVFPMLYPGLFFTLLLTLQDLSSPLNSTLMLVLAFFIASVNDTFALFIGLKFGKHRLSPEISPKKSIEGAVAGLISSVVFAVLAAVVARAIAAGSPELAEEMSWSPLPPLWAFALLGLFAGTLSQIGDLAASMIKRHCGIKDFGAIFPGHGGMLDRLDGILFCGAACWFFAQWFTL